MLLGGMRGAAVLEQHHLVVAIVAVAHGGLHHRLRGDARADDALDAVRAQVGCEVRGVEGTHTVLGDQPVALLAPQPRMDLGARGADAKELVRLRGREHGRPLRAFRVVCGEPDAHEADRHAGGARLRDGSAGPRARVQRGVRSIACYS